MNSAFGTMGRQSLERDWLTWKRVGVFQVQSPTLYRMLPPLPAVCVGGGEKPDERKL